MRLICILSIIQSSNVLFSTLLSQHDEKRNACTAYFLSIFVDCTLGVLIIYSALRIFSYVLIQRLHLQGYRSGQYYVKPPISTDTESGLLYDASVEEVVSRPHGISSEDEESRKPATASDHQLDASSGIEQPSKPTFQWSWWGKQLLVYLASLVVMKLAILGFFWIPAIFEIGDWLLSWLGEDTKIVFVLMIFPLAMNALQFLLIDTILKSKTPFSDTTSAKAEAQARSSRRGSEDHGHSGEEDEGRPFLLDNTHDDLEAGTSLPAYQSHTSVHSGSSHGSGKSQSQSQSQSQHELRPAASLHSSSSRTNSSAPYGIASASVAVEKVALNAIPLKVVSQQHHPSVLSLRSEKTDNDDNETNGWDWLSEDGNVQTRQSEDGWNLDQQSGQTAWGIDSNTQNPVIKTAKVA